MENYYRCHRFIRHGAGAHISAFSFRLRSAHYFKYHSHCRARDAQSVVFALDCVVTMLTMFGLGAAKAKVTNTSIIQQGFLMCVNGALACGAGYLISWALSSLLKEEDCANSTP